MLVSLLKLKLKGSSLRSELNFKLWVEWKSSGSHWGRGWRHSVKFREKLASEGVKGLREHQEGVLLLKGREDDRVIAVDGVHALNENSENYFI